MNHPAPQNEIPDKNCSVCEKERCEASKDYCLKWHTDEDSSIHKTHCHWIDHGSPTTQRKGAEAIADRAITAFKDGLTFEERASFNSVNHNKLSKAIAGIYQQALASERERTGETINKMREAFYKKGSQEGWHMTHLGMLWGAMHEAAALDKEGGE